MEDPTRAPVWGGNGWGLQDLGEFTGKGVMGMDDGLSDLSDLDGLSRLVGWLADAHSRGYPGCPRMADVSILVSLSSNVPRPLRAAN